MKPKLIKTLFLITLLLLTTQISANELEWVDKQIKAIKPPRIGISSKNVNKLKNPFIFLNATQKPTNKNSTNTSTAINSKKHILSNRYYYKTIKHKYFTLSAIMNGYALINSTWYKLNEKIKGYTISNITPTTVLLTKKNKKIVLSTKSKNLPLKFKNR